MKVNVVRFDELGKAQLRQWETLQSANSALNSPYFSWQFTAAVAAVRRDVQIAVMEDANGIVGFFPFQKTTMGMGRPVGGALSDFQAVIAAPETQWDAQELIRKCGLSLWDFDHLLASQTSFAAYHRKTEISPYMDLSSGYENYA